MIREAAQSDAPALERFLARYPDSSMFLRSNLAAHGVGLNANEYSSRYFIWGEDRVQGVFGLSKKGYLMVQLPDAETEAAECFARMIEDETVLGMTGDAHQVEVTLGALGLGQAKYRLNHDEPLYRRDLHGLTEAPVPYRDLRADDRARLHTWFTDYIEDTGQAAGEEARELAAERVEAELTAGRAIVLMEGDAPVAMASVNAKVHDQIQVGGVFVPRKNRNRGLGRRVTTALMQKAKSEGAAAAILFANNAPAARAYEAIGFQQVGWYKVALLQEPQRVLS
ncbi:GNAT family N-acetyltransferase [Ruegeria sp. HKCCSP335]|uniref:GNAT family N-acetyltransferase n=2 Tax=unclassified Ruegeria TaxID=2625375 RepID=UPI001AE43E8C